VKWQRSSDNSTWSDIVSTSNPYNTGALSATTYFRAVVQSGACTVENSSSALVIVNPLAPADTTVAVAQLSGWNLFSLPVPQMDMSSTGVFGDDAGSSTAAWQFIPGIGYQLPDTLRLGRAYWLYQLNAINVDAIGIHADSLSVPLSAGWNLVGYPFPTPGFWGSCATMDSGGVRRSLVDAVASNWIVNTMYSFNGVGYATSDDTARVWTGYWFYTLQDNLSLVWRNRGFSKAPAWAVSAGWEIPLSGRLDTGEGSVSDRIAVFGVRSGATDGFDPSFDASRPPSPPTGLALSIGFAENGATLLARDIRSAEHAEWNAVVRSSCSGMVTLSWPSPNSAVPVVLVDEIVGARIDMRNTASYTFAHTEGDRRLRIEAGNTGSMRTAIPAGILLEQNHPNPFRPETSIRFGLPDGSHVIVRVYDVYGREIATLADGLYPAGMHTVQFQANGLPSGMYLCRLESAGVSLTRLMTLTR
jgi:hypothetical protein